MGDGEDRSRKERIAGEENSGVASNCYKTAFVSLSSHMHSSDQLRPARLNRDLLVNMLFRRTPLRGHIGQATDSDSNTHRQKDFNSVLRKLGAHICITMPIKLKIKGL